MHRRGGLLTRKRHGSHPVGRESMAGLDVEHMDGLAHRGAFMVGIRERHLLRAGDAASNRGCVGGSLVGVGIDLKSLALPGATTSDQHPRANQHSHGVSPFFCLAEASSAQPILSASVGPCHARAPHHESDPLGLVVLGPCVPYSGRRGRFSFSPTKTLTRAVAAHAAGLSNFTNEKPLEAEDHPGVLIANADRLPSDRHFLSVSFGLQGLTS